MNTIPVNKQALQQYRQLCREIKELEAEKEMLAAGNLAASQMRAGAGRSGRPADPVGQTAARLWQLAQLVCQSLNRLVPLRQAIEEALEPLPPADRLLLRLLYIKGLSFEEAAEQLEYSPRHLRRRHQQIMNKWFPDACGDRHQSFIEAMAAPAGS